MRVFGSAALLTLTLAVNASAQSTIFVVRHAERADTASGGAPMMAADPELSDAGRARAESLATVLKDANITAIFTTEFKRTQQTAAPLAKALGIRITPIGSRDAAKLTQALKGASGNALVVGHSNTVPAIIRDLGASDPVTLGDGDYDNLFVVTMGAPAHVVRLHFR
jgi:broad specificity phosphatase PhoE